MSHPLYPVACRLVGRPIVAYHVRGSVHHGILQQVAPHGIYMLPYGAGYASGDKNDLTLNHAMDSTNRNYDLVYAPGAFFAFGALTGLTLGALAGGYGYGYGGYGGGYGGYGYPYAW